MNPAEDREQLSTSPEVQRRFTEEIISAYLLSTIEEMIEACRRSAYSTTISQALDFTCGLFDESGRQMVAQASGIAIHAGALVAAIDVVLQTYHEFEPGDVIIHNDPYRGGCHQADVAVTKPLFYRTGQLVGFAINRGHIPEMGGMAPGNWAGTAQHVVEEALFIPPAKLYKGGKLDREIKDFVLSNVRLPRLVWGDLQSLVAACVTAERRMEALLDKYGFDTVRAAEEWALDYSRQRFLAHLETVPNGTWRGEEFFEDHAFSAEPRYVRATVTKRPGKLIVDYAGTDAQVLAPINMSFVNAKAAAVIAALAMIDPEVPLNSGFLDLIDVRAPKGTLVNPTWPAPMFMGTADPVNKAYEAVLKSLAQAIPDKATAGNYQTGNNSTGAGINPRTGQPTQWYCWGTGGNGARSTMDGDTAEWHVCAGRGKNESIELWEHRYPVEFQEWSLITDSGGPGRFRGGLGHRRRFKLLSNHTVSAISDRHKVGAWGFTGGMPAKPNRFAVLRDGNEFRFNELFDIVSPSKFANIPLRTGDEFILDGGGGGGYGDPLERDPLRVARDVEFGYVSPASARDVYGVVLGPNFSISSQTKTLRARLRRARAARRAPEGDAS